MKKLLLILLCLSMIGFGQQTKKAKKYTELAEKYLKKAKGNCNPNAKRVYNLNECEVNTKKAIKYYTKAIKADPDFVEGYLFRGICYSKWFDLIYSHRHDAVALRAGHLYNYDIDKYQEKFIHTPKYFDKEGYKKAINDFKKAIEINSQKLIYTDYNYNRSHTCEEVANYYITLLTPFERKSDTLTDYHIINNKGLLESCLVKDHLFKSVMTYKNGFPISCLIYYKNGNLFFKSKGHRFSVGYTYFYENGQIKEKGVYVDADEKTFWGKYKYKSTYFANKRLEKYEGEFGENPTPIEEYKHYNSRYRGFYIRFPNGDPSSNRVLTEHLLDAQTQERYNEDGILVFKENDSIKAGYFDSGQLSWMREKTKSDPDKYTKAFDYYENGNLSRVSKDTLIDLRQYYTGKLLEDTEEKEAKGDALRTVESCKLYRKYFLNGKVEKSTISIKYNNNTIEELVFYDNGNLKSKKSYILDYISGNYRCCKSMVANYVEYDENTQIVFEDGLEISKGSFVINNQDIRKINLYNIEDFVNIFLDDCKQNNIHVSNQNILASFRQLKGSTIALAYGRNKDSEIEIEIDPVNWKNASIQKKWYIIYHELGHDVLNFKHGQGGKMMFNFVDRDYSWTEFFTDKRFMFDYYKEKE